jgi:hypothetical protein
MREKLVTTGLACIIAAVVGGGLKAFGLEIGVISSVSRQGLLASLGVALLIAGVYTSKSAPQRTSSNTLGGDASTADDSNVIILEKNSPAIGTDGRLTQSIGTLSMNGFGKEVAVLAAALKSGQRTPAGDETVLNVADNTSEVVLTFLRGNDTTFGGAFNNHELGRVVVRGWTPLPPDTEYRQVNGVSQPVLKHRAGFRTVLRAQDGMITFRAQDIATGKYLALRLL